MKQKTFLLNVISKGSMLATFHYGFWAFIYPAAWWGRSLWLGMISSGINWVLAPACFLLWMIFDTWANNPELLPSFKLERGKKTTEETKQPEKTEGESLPL